MPRAVFALSGFSVSKYQIADKLHNAIGPLLWNFWYFHFYSRSPNTIPCEFLTLFPIHRVFAGVSLSVSFRTPLALLLCAFWCAQNAVPRDEARKTRKNGKNVEKCNNKFDNFNTFWNPQPLIVFTTKIFHHSLLWRAIILAKRAQKKAVQQQQKSAMKYVLSPGSSRPPVEHWFLC